MNLRSHYGRAKRRRNSVLLRCAAMRAARERKRIASVDACDGWRRVCSALIVVHAAPDGKHIALRYSDGHGTWSQCGSERAVRATLARLLWGVRNMAVQKVRNGHGRTRARASSLVVWVALGFAGLASVMTACGFPLDTRNTMCYIGDV